MSQDQHTPSKLEIATHAVLPLLLMLLIEMALNHFGGIPNSIFISPYLLAFFITGAIAFVVLWKGQICPGQKGRLTFILPFLLVFALGHLAYLVAFTPKHSPMWVASCAALIFPLIYWKLPEDEIISRTLIYCGLATVAVGVVQYLMVYWVEIPSLFNWARANNFAQLQLGILLAGWYLVLARSRLEGFLKLLVQLALFALIANYIWTVFVLYQHLQRMPTMAISPYLLFFAGQFVILAMLGWLLLGKNIKQPTAWTVATFLSLLYPLINAV
ncbi:hypothetical protein E4T80_06395 [Muribacter muris]|uniref:Uncharacterized protein n=1 Tax=Muribacter muris TaxID=67855 RepID=A0A4Y9K094_9PAST|nr:hypothetical protein [Muribacter muris]MBF0785095.1 hypothetical protein [Muribacter muris]MBF0826891.1 hypothetical protein [Muribacter muris]TFV10187.1 hypothetical protein E4T80_06395 [Muribacter muris]